MKSLKPSSPYSVGGSKLVPQNHSRTRPSFWRPASWTPVADNKRDHNVTNDTAHLRIGTLNRWFEARHANTRNDSVIGILDKLDWDVFCLQETTQAFILHAARHHLAQKKWVMSDSSGSTLPPGGHGLFTMYNPKTVEVISIHNQALPNSRQRRYYQVSVVRLRDKTKSSSTSRPLRIINVHLESPTLGDIASEARAEQLAHLHEVAKELYDDAAIPTLVIGDLNLVSAEEDTMSATHFTDTWKVLRPDELGHTWPSAYHRPSIPYPPSRPDRVLFLDTGCLRPVGIDIVFDQPVRVDDFGDVPLSDHVGLLARMDVLSLR
jgi:endonuclease/exonuclease/phosphatase family metal-dependent hydrolase